MVDALAEGANRHFLVLQRGEQEQLDDAASSSRTFDLRGSAMNLSTSSGVERVKRMEELFLRHLLAFEEMHVVHHPLESGRFRLLRQHGRVH
jgi:hypothetical protein